MNTSNDMEIELDMEVKLKTDINNRQPYITVNVPSKTPYVEYVINKIKKIFVEDKFTVKDDNGYMSVPISEIIRVYTEGNSVYCEFQGRKLKIKERIYQMKDLLPDDSFFQVSQSEIINRRYIDKFKLTSSGLYVVFLTNGLKTYASRRCMTNIKRKYLK